MLAAATPKEPAHQRRLPTDEVAKRPGYLCTQCRAETRAAAVPGGQPSDGASGPRFERRLDAVEQLGGADELSAMERAVLDGWLQAQVAVRT